MSKKVIGIRKVRDDYGWMGNMGICELMYEGKKYKSLECVFIIKRFDDEEIKEYRKAEHKKIKNDPIYKDLQKARAEAYRNKEEYLFKNDIRLSELRQILSGK